MKLTHVLLKVKEIVIYLRMSKKRRLYSQWVEKAGLPPVAVPLEMHGVNMIGGKGSKVITVFSKHYDEGRGTPTRS